MFDAIVSTVKLLCDTAIITALQSMHLTCWEWVVVDVATHDYVIACMTAPMTKSSMDSRPDQVCLCCVGCGEV